MKEYFFDNAYGDKCKCYLEKREVNIPILFFFNKIETHIFLIVKKCCKGNWVFDYKKDLSKEWYNITNERNPFSELNNYHHIEDIIKGLCDASFKRWIIEEANTPYEKKKIIEDKEREEKRRLKERL